MRKRQRVRGLALTKMRRSDREAVEWFRSLSSARGRIGTTPADRFRWLINFAQRDVEGLVRLEGVDLAALDAEIYAFTFSKNFSDAGSGFRQPPLSAAVIAGLASAMNTVLRNFVKGSQLPLDAKPRSILWRNPQTLRITRIYSGPQDACFPAAALDLLEKEGGRLQQCAGLRDNAAGEQEKCLRLFIKHKRRIYCSPACSQKDRTRRYLNRKGTAAISDRRHTYYVRGVKKRKGQSFANKVGRRTPRKGTNPTITRSPGLEPP